ncbi:MAG: GNAT family N-acetyltransferase [Candidatus Hydrogenedentales bacterium]|jgi:GNAT superfamily N-acetyltransferase
MSAYTIEIASRAEVDIAVAYAAQEGWNPGNSDAACFYAADPQGFLVGRVDGEIVATISAVRYGVGFGFIGLYIVCPEYRGKGYGRPIFEEAVRRLSDVASVGLDGVVAQQQNYMKSGFILAYRNIRFEGVGGGDAPAEITPIEDVPFDAVLRYDASCFAVPREAFLRAWLSQPDAHVCCALAPCGALSGYGVIRPCRNGFKIGPLFADDANVADALYRALISKAPGAPVFLDVPEVNPAAVALAKRYGLSQCFETARMYKGEPPGVPVERVFGVTTFELG